MLKRGNSDSKADWKGVRIHLAKAHKMNREQQDDKLEQLEIIHREARCIGSRSLGEPLGDGVGGRRRRG